MMRHLANHYYFSRVMSLSTAIAVAIASQISHIGLFSVHATRSLKQISSQDYGVSMFQWNEILKIYQKFDFGST